MYNNYTISHVRGTTIQIPVEAVFEDGTEYTFDPTDIVVFAMHKDGSTTRALTKIARPDAGIVLIEIAALDTINLDPGIYIYEISVQSGTDFFNIIPPSVYELLENTALLTDATDAYKFSVSYILRGNATVDDPVNAVALNDPLTVVIYDGLASACDTVVVTMGGEDVTDDVYDSSTMTVSIESVTGDVVIMGVAS